MSSGASEPPRLPAPQPELVARACAGTRRWPLCSPGMKANTLVPHLNRTQSLLQQTHLHMDRPTTSHLPKVSQLQVWQNRDSTLGVMAGVSNGNGRQMPRVRILSHKSPD